MKKILAIFTCYNRKEKTERCIRSLTDGNPQCIFTYVAVDDGSNDGTRELLDSMQREYDLHVLTGDGSLYYSGGMRKGMKYALKSLPGDYDYLLMFNDDVDFYVGSIEKMAAQSIEQSGAVIVGAMCGDEGQHTYGAVKYQKGIRYRKLSPEEWNVPADTFNANAVLIPYSIFRHTGAIDEHYVHSLGDFDYGLEIKRKGYAIYSSREFVGKCNSNSSKGTWTDTNLSIRERIRRKESVKGAPTKQWFYFLKKNFGVWTAIIRCWTAYVRILSRR